MKNSADNLNMPSRYQSVWWSLELPAGWRVEAEESCTSFFAEDGVGTLQISAYRRDTNHVTDTDLIDFAEDESVEGVKPKRVTCGALTGIEVSYTLDNRFWHKWWLRKDSLLLYATYNCGTEDQALEVEIVNRILNSLRPE